MSALPVVEGPAPPRSHDPRVCVHEVDAEDRIVRVNAAWVAFAARNLAPELTESAVLSVPLLQYICDADTRQLYRMLLARVRGTGGAVGFNFRCDAPAVRRFMGMEITPLAGGAVRFTSVVLREEHREPVVLLDVAAQRGTRFVKVCGWCKRVLVGGERWVEVEEAMQELELFYEAVLPQLTHGMCQPCHDRVTAAFEA